MIRSQKRFVTALLAVILAAGLVAIGSTQTSSAPKTKLKVGDTAPDFTLKDQSGKEVSLHDFRGKQNVALAFYVFAFSGG